MNIKKNDTVIVLSGKDKGVKGKVLTAMPKENKVIVEKVNVATCHTKPRRQGEPAASSGVRPPSAPARWLCSARSATRAFASATRWTATRRSASAASAAPKSDERRVISWLAE